MEPRGVIYRGEIPVKTVKPQALIETIMQWQRPDQDTAKKKAHFLKPVRKLGVARLLREIGVPVPIRRRHKPKR